LAKAKKGLILVTNDVKQSSATLIFRGQGEPSAITKLLGLNPSESWKTGDQVRHVDGEVTVRRSSGWKLIQEETKSELSLNDQLQYWTTLLASRATELKQIREQGYQISLICFVICGNSPTFDLAAKTIASLGVLGVDLEFEMMFYEEG
jgi:Domain of unknown function (DUF4279)